jgi:hypothetical protein
VAGAPPGTGKQTGDGRLNKRSAWAAGGIVALALAAGSLAAGSTGASAAAGPVETGFFAVRVDSSSSVWAVGDQSRGSVYGFQPMAMHWNGKTWTRTPVPNAGDTAGGEIGRLFSVAVVSHSDVWAVGLTSVFPGDPYLGIFPLVDHWNGKTWKQVSALPKNTSDGRLYSLSSVNAVSENNVWAVGTTALGFPVILHWNGKAWSLAKAPAVRNSDGQTLSSVTALSANSVWAAGSNAPYTVIHGKPSPAGVTPYLLHWNGKAWNSVKAPAPHGGSSGNEEGTQGIAASARDSSTSILAVGEFDQDHTYLADCRASCLGVATPSQPSASATLDPAAIAISGSSTWIAGYGFPDNAEHWNGKAWSLVSIGGEASMNVTGLASTSTASTWAVGSGDDPLRDGSENGLIYRYNGKTWAQVAYPLEGF